MRTCCTSFSFDRDISEGKMALQDFYSFCHDAGIEGAELWDLHLPQEPNEAFVRETRKGLQAYDLTLATVAVNNHDFTSTDVAKRARDIAQVNRWLDAVAALDCSILRVLPGDLKVLNTYRDERYPIVKAAFEECLEHAQSLGVVLAIENCPREARHDAVLDLIKDLDTPFLGTCPDIGNLPHAARYQAWQELVPYAVHVHAKTFDFDDQGEETTFDYSRIMSTLKASEFDGFVSIEFEGDGDEAVGVLKGLALVRRHMGL